MFISLCVYIYIYTHTCVLHVCIYIYRERERYSILLLCYFSPKAHAYTPNLPANIVDVRGFDTRRILPSRAGILMSIGNLPESLSQAMLAGIMSVGGLGVATVGGFHSSEPEQGARRGTPVASQRGSRIASAPPHPGMVRSSSNNMYNNKKKKKKSNIKKY